jgi:hypothetical protein
MGTNVRIPVTTPSRGSATSHASIVIVIDNSPVRLHHPKYTRTGRSGETIFLEKKT